MSATAQQVIVDTTTARPDVTNYGIDATYALTDLETNQIVLRGRAFSRVSYDIPGQQQRFAGSRAQRDAQNRASKVLVRADQAAPGVVFPRRGLDFLRLKRDSGIR